MEQDTQATMESFDSYHEWWHRLPFDWKSIFTYGYLLNTNPQSLSEIVWKAKEITGVDETGNLIGFVNYELLEVNDDIEKKLVAAHANDTRELFDFSTEFIYSFSFEGNSYKIFWDFFPKTTVGIHGLSKIEKLYLYKQDNDKEKQPKISMADISSLSSLNELHLHITHSEYLQDILLLNLPSLKKIVFYTGANANSYNYDLKDWSIVDSFRGRTRIAIELSCYMD